MDEESLDVGDGLQRGLRRHDPEVQPVRFSNPHAEPLDQAANLGLKPLKDTTSPRSARLLKRVKKVEQLAPGDQRALLKMLAALLQARRGRDGGG